MEKIKNILPGHHKDDNTPHGTNVGAGSTPYHPEPAGPGKEGYKWDTFHGRYVPIHSGDSDRMDSPMNATHPHGSTSTTLPTRPAMAEDFATDASIKSGVQGYPPQSKSLTSDAAVGSTSLFAGLGDRRDHDSSAPGYQSQPTEHKSDAAVGSTSLLGGLGHRRDHDHDSTQPTTGREFPLTGSTGPRTGAEIIHHDGIPPPVAVVEETVRDHTHKGIGHHYIGDPCPRVEPAGPHFTAGPHATDTANKLDPHVRGNDGLPLEHAGTTGVGSTGLYPLASGTSDVETTRVVPPSTASHGITESRPDHDSHLGRNTAIAGATGAAGLGALASGRDHHTHDHTHDHTPATTMPMTGGPTGAAGLGALAPTRDHHTHDHTPAAIQPVSTQPSSGLHEHKSPYSSSAVDPRVDSRSTHDHNTRNVAAVGTAGAVGAAGTTYLAKDRKAHDGDSSSDEESRKKKSGGLMGFLHRDKDKHAKDKHVKDTHTHTHKDTHSHTHKDTHTHTDHGRHHGIVPAAAAGAGVGVVAADEGLHTQRGHLHRHDSLSSSDDDIDTGRKKTKSKGLLHREKDTHETGHGNHAVAPVVATGAIGAGAVAYNQASHRDNVPATGYEQNTTVHQATTYPATTTHHDTTHHDKEKKSGGLLGFLHRDKDKDHHDTVHDRHHDTVHDRHHNTAPVAAAGSGAVLYDQPRDSKLAPQHGDHHTSGHHHPDTTVEAYGHNQIGEPNRLHKDPPPHIADQLVTKGPGTQY